MKNSNLENITVKNSKDAIPYTPSGGPRGKENIPQRDRVSHGNLIKQSYEGLVTKQLKKMNENTILDGTYLEFNSEPNYDIITKSLEDVKNDIKLMNIKTKKDEENNDIISATVFIPKGTEKVFLKKVDEYLNTEKDTKNSNPKNMKLINGISNIKLANLESFWIGNPEEIPSGSTKRWCEIWIQNKIKNTRKNLEEEFINKCQELHLDIKDGKIEFEERTVFLVKANESDLKNLIELTNVVTEIRLAPETAHFFIDLPNKEQSEWADDLKTRTEINKANNVSVSILDTGINDKNKILSDFFDEQGISSYNPEWNTTDNNGHGTNLAGIAAYFNIEELLQKTDMIEVNHDLESVKILPEKGENEPELYGHITNQAVNLLKINRPNQKRVICLAITTEQSKDGKPTSWSAAIDNQIYNDEEKTLFLISAGNKTQD